VTDPVDVLLATAGSVVRVRVVSTLTAWADVYGLDTLCAWIDDDPGWTFIPSAPPHGLTPPFYPLGSHFGDGLPALTEMLRRPTIARRVAMRALRALHALVETDAAQGR
jgi:hypothetical protein